MSFKEGLKSIYGKFEKVFKSEKPQEEKSEVPTQEIEKEKEYNFHTAVETIASEKHPKNEDAFIINQEKGTLGIFDGVGGHSKEFTIKEKVYSTGEIASNEAALKVAEILGEIPLSAAETEGINKMQEAILEAQNHLQRIAQNHPEFQKMATTASVMKLVENGKKLILGQIGDSRIYRFRKGKLEQISPEDSYVAVAKKYGLIATDENVEAGISINDVIMAAEKTKDDPEAGRDLGNLMAILGDVKREFREQHGITLEKVPLKWFRNYVTKALSTDETVMPHIRTFDTKEGDIYFACSDGVCDNLTDSEIQEMIEKGKNEPPRKIAKEFTLAAKSRSQSEHSRAKDDDITAGILKIEKKGIYQSRKPEEINAKKEEKALSDFEKNSRLYTKEALKSILEQIGEKIKSIDAALKRSPSNEELLAALKNERKWEMAAAAALREKLEKDKKLNKKTPLAF